MHILLTTLNIVYVLTDARPEENENETLQDTRKRKKWENDDYVCRGCILNGTSSKPKKPFKKKEYSVKQNQKFKKQKGACFHCGKTRHFQRECYFLKKKRKAPALAHEKFIAVISEINLMEDDTAWWIDSGATKHVCKDKSLFKTLKLEPEGNVLYVGNSAAVQVKGKGTVDLEFTSGKVLTLTDVHYVPDIRKNLVSASLLNKFGFKLVFEAEKFILSKGGIFVGKGYAYEGMFKMNINYNINNKGVVSAYILDSFNLWHHRLGHVNFKKMYEMSKLELIPTLPKNESQCKTCRLTKITRIPFPKIERVSKLLDLVHSDVCDMHSTPSIGGKKYYVPFIDDYSKFCYVYLLNTKDEAMEKFKVYKVEVELQTETFIKCLRTDRGGEYYDPSYFESTGIIHEITAPYTPQQNGVAKRKNRVLTEMVNAMLSNSGLSPGFWGEALLTACHILNRVPTKKGQLIPYELWKKRKPNLNYLRVWGCKAIVRVPEPKRKKLGERGIECIFLGYAKNSKAYRFMVIEPNDSINVNTIIESRDAIFEDSRVNSIPRPKEAITESSEQRIEDNLEENKLEENIEVRRSKRARKARTYSPEFYMFLIEGTREKTRKATKFCYNIEADPVTFEEAIKSQDSAFWKEAIDEEMSSIMGNNTWILVDLPPDEEVYMEQPEGFVMPGQEKKVCKLIKSLYGLKQAPKQWHQKFDEVVLANGFKLNEADKCVYSKFKNGQGVLICLYVDDMLIFGTNIEQVEETKRFLSRNFSMKDMGAVDVIFGIKIHRDGDNLILSQSHYIEKVLKKFNFYDCAIVSTPFDPNVRLTSNDGKPIAQLEYSRVIGCLMYAMICTRPNIAYAVGKLSRYTSNPNSLHWQGIHRVLKYLKKTMYYGICYNGYPSVLEGFTDASWITDHEDHKSTTGWIFMLGGGAVSWGSKKQTCITDSTMAAEFIALNSACKEVALLMGSTYMSGSGAASRSWGLDSNSTHEKDT
ncbi:hypothetical protein SLEP1_g12666 [Rubroshorea leprosula]|uniref:Uncharacterized protein n=1 Tax=Rubroshorea leprosula TaxID=152421 RepID=A0AAV5IDA5_9ROSI|nr:hypothetical protein SLEP1_g12666 [Rubroshorea leprosula]